MDDPTGQPGELVLLGEIVGVHGVRGLVKVRAFTEEAESLTAYGPLVDQRGREIRLTLHGQAKGNLLAAVDGITDRTQAEGLRGRKLFVRRDALPPADRDADEYYHADLIGLTVELENGERFGRVAAVQSYGAGDVLEIAVDADGRRVLVPFTHEMVPEVDLAGERLIIAPMPGLLD